VWAQEGRSNWRGFCGYLLVVASVSLTFCCVLLRRSRRPAPAPAGRPSLVGRAAYTMRDVCRDNPSWNNGPRPGGPLDCAAYEAKGYCKDRTFAKGFEWTGGKPFNHPERHCCACGKGNGVAKKPISLAAHQCRCPGVSVCSNYTLASFMMRMPSTVSSVHSPWHAYLKAVYRSKALPLPVDLRPFEAFYPALLPVAPCTNTSHLEIDEERRWQRAWPTTVHSGRHRFAHGSSSGRHNSRSVITADAAAATAKGRAACSRALCEAWLPNPTPDDAAVIAFTATRSYVRVAARNDTDMRAFGSVVVLQRPAATRRPRGQPTGPRRTHVQPSPTATRGKTADRWIEVTRTAFPGEGYRGYGCWFHPAVGSGVFVGVDRRLHLSWANRMTARQTVYGWSGKPQAGFRGDGDLPRMASERRWASFEILSSHGYTAGFEELGITAPAHELVLMDDACMSHMCACRVQKQRMCRCQLRTGCVPLVTSTGWNASRTCACDEAVNSEVINCGRTSIE
jgi:hypothetical protein